MWQIHYHISKPSSSLYSRVERSSDQVIKPINLEALTKWVGHIPEDVVRDMADIAPMLSVLGYDPYANPPNYGKPDELVADNTKNVQQNMEHWERKAKELFDVGWGDGGDSVLDREPSDNPANGTWYVMTVRCFRLQCEWTVEWVVKEDDGDEDFWTKTIFVMVKRK